jgi:hypothetical protein
MEFPDDVVGGKAKRDVCWHRCCWLSWVLLLLAAPTTIVAPRVAKGNGQRFCLRIQKSLAFSLENINFKNKDPVIHYTINSNEIHVLDAE